MTTFKSRPSFRHALLAGVVMSSVSVFAHAETAAATSAADNGLRVQDVIVTARKREENVQRVPIAITAITGQLKSADIRDVTDIVAFTPNVRIDTYAQRANSAVITIRGISPSRLDDNSIDSPIGVLIDGIYLGTLTGQVIQNFDVDRIEVLRGPQGTLFGRNTVGGALNVVRSEPTGKWGAKVQYTTGSWNDQEFRGVLNAPVIQDKLALKLFFISENRDGFVHNTFLNSNQPQKNFKNYGGVLKFTPNDNFKASLTVERFDDRSQGGAFFGNYNTTFGGLPAPKSPSDINAPGTALAGTAGAEIATFLPAAFGLTNVPIRTNVGVIPKTIDDNFPSPGNVQTYAYTLNMSYKLNPNLTLVSVSGYRKQHELASEDFDGTSTNLINISTDAHYHQFSQELRLQGNWDTSIGKINFVAGGYYWNSYFDRKWITSGDFWTFISDLSGYDLADNTWSAANAAKAGFADPISGCLATRDSTPVAADGTPTQAQNRFAIFGRVQCDSGVPGGGAGYGRGLVNKLYETQQTDSVAGFARADWEFLPKLTLTAGVRYTWERKHFVGYQSYVLPISRTNIDNFPSNANLTNSWTRVTPTAALAYQMTPSILWYASFAEGWHSGGFFGVNQNASDFLSNQYKPETAKSYELGMKGQFFDHRVQLNVAGFLNDFANKQESSIQFDKTTNTVVTVFTNVGGLRYEGIEAELQWIVTRQFNVSGSLGYLHAKYTNLKIGYPSNQTGPVPIIDATFLIPRSAPKITLGGTANYTLHVGPGALALGAKVVWVDSEYTSLYNESYSFVPSHTDISASLSYSYEGYKVTVFGRNLTGFQHENPTFIAPLFASSTWGPPASWGVELAAKF